MTKNKDEEYVAIVRAFEIGQQNSLYLNVSKDARTRLNLQKGDKFLLKIDTKGRLVYEPIHEHAAQRGANNDR